MSFLSYHYCNPVTKECCLILWPTNRTRLISFFQPYSYSTVYDTTNEEVCQTIPKKECRDAVKTEYKTVPDRQCVTEKQQQCSTVTEYVTENVCSQGNRLMSIDNKIVRRLRILRLLPLFTCFLIRNIQFMRKQKWFDPMKIFRQAATASKF